MPFHIDHAAADGVIRLVFSGPVEIEDRARALREIMVWLDRPGTKHVLVDSRNAHFLPASPQASDEHATNLARRYRQLTGARIAYLSGPEHRPASAVEQLAAVRGYYYQRFTDEAAALGWLGSSLRT